MVGEYEAKRLRRMEENRLKLQSLQLPVMAKDEPVAPPRKRKRETMDANPVEPTRKSSRMRKKRKFAKQERRNAKELRKMEKAQVHMEKVACKLAKQQRREEKEQRRLRKLRTKVEHQKVKYLHKVERKVKKEEEEKKKKEEKKKEEEEREREVEEEVEEKMMQVFGPPLHTQLRIEDWRVRRRLLRQEEERRMSLRKRIERRELRLQEKIKEKEKRLWQRELAKRERKDARRSRLELQQKEKEKLRLERDAMRREDRLARELVKFKAKEEKRRRLEAKNALKDQKRWEKMLVLHEEAKQEHEERYKQKYPVRKCHALPFVQMSATLTKPLVVTPLLKLETTLFHSFSMGKQFLPPGKESVMQALCPRGYTPLFAEDSDIHIWQNGMALFVPCSSGMYFEYLFQEDEQENVLFPWRRCRDVTPFHLWHLSQVQRGEETLRLNDSYYETPFPEEKPLPLLLFVQYPNGPYVYFGRLGYLGYNLTPDVEFSFQLLDTDTLNWQKTRRYFIAADENRVSEETIDE